MIPKVSFQSWCIQNDAESLLQFYKNGDNVTPPDEIGFSSGKYVQFRCAVCGLSWSKTLNKATRKTGLPVVKTCPYCDHRKPSSFYNLAVEYPELALEWDREKNESAPELKLPNSHEKVFWHCSNNHRWKATIRDRVRTVKKARESGKPICPYCAGEIASATYNLAVEYPDIAREWDYVQNGDKKPEDFLPHSNEKVWWACSYNPSHHWKSRISNRTCLNRGCKHCSKEFKISYPARVLFYYLRQVCPDCVCEYPFQKKYKIDLFIPSLKLAIEHDEYYYHSNEASRKRDEEKDKALREVGYQVLRVCDSKDMAESFSYKQGVIEYRFDERSQYFDKMVKAVFQYLGLSLLDFDHERDRKQIDQMYYHERKKHTLAVEHPNLAKEWSHKNSMGADTVSSGSSRMAWWHCPKCGEEYQAIIANRVKKHTGCTYCANLKAGEKNCLATLRPDIAAQWDYELNYPLTPHQVVPGSERKVYWKCPNGHTWQASVSNRCGKKQGCPKCAKKTRKHKSIVEECPQLLCDWDQDKNEKPASAYSARSNIKVWWRCNVCGYEWQATPDSQFCGSGCPACAKKRRGAKTNG